MLDKSARLGSIVANASSVQDVFKGLSKSVEYPERFLVGCESGAPVLDAFMDDRLEGIAPGEWMMAQDTLGYLPSDILVKVDRATIATSLETRAPFLDIRTVEVAWRLPMDHRIRDGKRKQILRDILDRHVPRELIERRIQDFSVPLDRLLRGDLRDRAKGRLSREALMEGGLLLVQSVREIWMDHVSGRGNHGQTLWASFMLQAWLREWHCEPAEIMADAAP